MSTALMDRSVAAALEQGRCVIVPTPQAGARLRLAWARRQIAAGRKVWASPDVLTWEAWLAREWQRGVDPAHPAARLRVLNRAQERRLWSDALHELEQSSPGNALLRLHAPALRRAATRARQWLLAAPHARLTAEEELLWRALRGVEQRAAARSAIILGLAAPETLAALAAPAPGFAGAAGLTPLQARLGELLWPGQSLLLMPDEPSATALQQWRAEDPGEEIRAAAAWCREQLAADPARRLLLVQGGDDMPLSELAATLWRHLTHDTAEALTPLRDAHWLAVAGGEPLLQHPMLEQAITLLRGLLAPLEMVDLSRLLLSPWFRWSDEDPAALEPVLRDLGRTNWPLPALLAALDGLAATHPAALQCATRLRAASAALGAETTETRTPGEWAGRFDRALATLDFPGVRALDSRDAQCHARWRELLDEFASLDALALRLDAPAAWQELEQLARHGAHEAASGDAAITLTDDRGDPLATHDGIWVLGLTEEAFPAPPRPDAFLALAAQRAALWPEASAELRRQQAMEELAGWRRRSRQLVLSYAATDGDLHRRPSRLLPVHAWQPLPLPAEAAMPQHEGMEQIVDSALPALVTRPGTALRGTSRRLQLQQDCPFRSQAEMRLGAANLEVPAEGIDPRLRGDLLHAALDGLWGELRDSRQLAALDPAARAALIQHHWHRAEHLVLAKRPLPPDERVLAREQRRGLALLARLLELEAARDAFEVVQREHQLRVAIDGVDMRLRVDRIDRLADGRRLLIDYKTGQSDVVSMDRESPRPLQLALYATALANQGQSVQALALARLVPGRISFKGVSEGDAGVPGIAPLADWELWTAQWRQEVQRLLAGHLAGFAAVAPAAGACRRCHLPALCRIGERATLPPEEEQETADE
ncbi:MAG: PD-(D/E)XK nuclease family protein [Steroidobacteraceae bacterium]